MSNSKVTMQSISEALGISKTSVSLVLKGDGDKYRISKKTQKKILNYAEKAGFTPDFLARALATKKTDAIGIIFPDVHEAFMSEMLKGIESVLYKSGYSIMLSTSGFDSEIERRNIRQMLRRKVDGMIIVPYVPLIEKNYKHDYIEQILKADCPSVFLDRSPHGNGNFDLVIQNDLEASAAAVRLLSQKGCKRIGCISFNLDTSTINNRLEGFKSGLQRCGLNYSNDALMLLNNQNPQSDDLLNILKNRITEREDFDGLLITTGGIAHKTGHLLTEKLKAVKKPLIAKFGRDPDYFHTGMIQIIQPNKAMGIAAAELLLDKIKQPDVEANQITIKSRIVDKEG